MASIACARLHFSCAHAYRFIFDNCSVHTECTKAKWLVHRKAIHCCCRRFHVQDYIISLENDFCTVTETMGEGVSGRPFRAWSIWLYKYEIWVLVTPATGLDKRTVITSSTNRMVRPESVFSLHGAALAFAAQNQSTHVNMHIEYCRRKSFIADAINILLLSFSTLVKFSGAIAI